MSLCASYFVWNGNFNLFIQLKIGFFLSSQKPEHCTLSYPGGKIKKTRYYTYVERTYVVFGANWFGIKNFKLSFQLNDLISFCHLKTS